MRAAVEVMAEDGFEGASTRDMAARAGVSVAALYHHFPSKLGLLREFLDEAYDVTLARIERRLDGVDRSRGAARERRRQRSSGRTCTTSSRSRRRSSRCASTRGSTPPERAAIEVKREGAARPRRGHPARTACSSGDFRTDEPREAARRSSASRTSLVGAYAEIGRRLDDVTALYQRFAVTLLAGASGSRPRA